MNFLKSTSLTRIHQKFCEPGHSSIQEIDNVHSQLEKALSRREVFSPLGVIRCFKQATRKPVKIIQMQEHHFRQYMETAKSFWFKNIPFSKVKSLTYKKREPFDIEVKTSFTAPAQLMTVRPRPGLRMTSPPRSPTDSSWPTVKMMRKQPQLSEEKVKDIKAMVKFMAPIDRMYMLGLINH